MEQLNSDVRAYFAAQADSLAAELRTLVEIESPSADKAAVDGVSRQAAAWMKTAGAQVEVLPQANAGDLVLGRWPGRTQAPPILLVGHMDTVWPVGTLAERPVRIEDGKLYGPGALDMKAGIVIALAALRALRHPFNTRPVAPVWMLCTSDEETGSEASRATIEAYARQSQLVLCLEPAMPGGALKTARKGVGHVIVRTQGRAAHAGGDHQKGINAIAEMAHHILALQALTDYDQGTTVNVGVIKGGIASNVVPESCEVEMDFRVSQPVEVERLMSAAQSLRPHHPQAQVFTQGSLNRPPMPRDDLMAATFQRARQVAAPYGWDLSEGSAGGASDANFTAALGIPTLDGLGADGDGFHAQHEHVIIASLAERAALLTVLLHGWSD